jgi:NAD(P)-dependent dehydrogenase (short-subunit alcohol dehydrogenase family)
MDDLNGKVAVVTGAASGIGRGIAGALVEAGARVVIADIELEKAEAAAAALPGDSAVGVRCDVTDRADVERLADESWTRFGRVDIMVNNAGVFPPMAKVLDIAESDARWVLEVNLMGVWFGCVAFGRRFVEQGTPAHIVNVGSENSVGVPHTMAAFYTASKHAVLGLSDVFRRELPQHVGVSVVCPGMVATALSDSARNRPERFGGAVSSGRPPGSMGMDPAEVGRRTVDGIRRGDFYIVTHPPVIELVDERATELTAAFAAQAPRFDGDEALSTTAVFRRLRSKD